MLRCTLFRAATRPYLPPAPSWIRKPLCRHAIGSGGQRELCWTEREECGLWGQLLLHDLEPVT